MYFLSRIYSSIAVFWRLCGFMLIPVSVVMSKTMMSFPQDKLVMLILFFKTPGSFAVLNLLFQGDILL